MAFLEHFLGYMTLSMKSLQDRVGLSEKKMWRRDWLGSGLDQSCKGRRMQTKKVIFCQRMLCLAKSLLDLRIPPSCHSPATSKYL